MKLQKQITFTRRGGWAMNSSTTAHQGLYLMRKEKAYGKNVAEKWLYLSSEDIFGSSFL